MTSYLYCALHRNLDRTKVSKFAISSDFLLSWVSRIAKTSGWVTSIKVVMIVFLFVKALSSKSKALLSLDSKSWCRWKRQNQPLELVFHDFQNIILPQFSPGYAPSEKVHWNFYIWFAILPCIGHLSGQKRQKMLLLLESFCNHSHVYLKLPTWFFASRSQSTAFHLWKINKRKSLPHTEHFAGPQCKIVVILNNKHTQLQFCTSYWIKLLASRPFWQLFVNSI